MCLDYCFWWGRRTVGWLTGCWELLGRSRWSQLWGVIDGRVVSKPWTHFPSCSRRMAPSFDSHSLWWRQKGLRLPALPSSTFHWEKEHRVINGIGTGTFRRMDSLQENHNAHIFLILTIRELEDPNYFAASQNPTSMVLKAFVCLKDPWKACQNTACWAYSKVPHSIVQGWDLRIFLPVSSDADEAGPGTTLWEALPFTESPENPQHS